MDLKRKALAIIAVLTLMLTLFGGALNVSAEAAGAEPVLNAVRNGDKIELSLAASEDLADFLGLQVDNITYDEDVFSYEDADVTGISGLTLEANSAENKIAIGGSEGVSVSSGENLFTISFSAGGNFQENTDYSFEVQLSEAYNDNFENYSWCAKTFTATYREGEEPEEEYFTFTDTAGEEYKLTTSLITSVDKTANDNYLLKDILAAAGVSEDKLADCRYEIASDPAQDSPLTIYIDADYYDDIAVYYQDGTGWRSTLEKNKPGIQGKWYKVTYLSTIKAENHKYEDGACTNGISDSKTTTVPCGAEEPVEEEYFTFTDTAGEEYKLTTSLITSVDKTANDNYLLKDILAAAGVSEDKLADCRYEIASDPAQDSPLTIYIDADYYDDIAVYYQDGTGWRSTLEKNKPGIQGKWYKVTYLSTIKAENHKYEDGACTNGISDSKTTTVPCGAHLHSTVLIEEKPATCDEENGDGVRAHYECEICHKLFSDSEATQEVLPEDLIIPHLSTHSFDTCRVTRKATTSAVGEEVWTCSVCGKTKKEAIPKVTAPSGKVTILNTVANSAKKTNDVIWDKSNVTGATGYIIEWRARGATKWASRKVGNVTRGVTSGLTVGNLYEIRVTPYKAETETTKEVIGTPSAIIYRYFYTTQKIRLASNSKGTFTMSWARDPKATGYQVLYTTNKNGSGAAQNIKSAGASATSITVKDIKLNGKVQPLRSGTTYYVQVREIRTVGGKNYIGNISCPVAVKVK